MLDGKWRKNVGRPSSFNQDTADEICARLADGESLRKICADEEMPAQGTVYAWLLKDEFKAFQEQYARARELQADTLFDECQDIADDGSNDYMETDTGPKYDGDAVQRSRLRIDTRKWMAGKLRPKKYGEAATLKLADADGEKLALDEVSKVTRLAAIAQKYQGLIGDTDNTE